MEQTTTCRKCGVGILQQTADRFRGQCAICWKSRLSARGFQSVAAVIGGALLFISLPFMIAFMSLQDCLRAVRFPYDRKLLKKAIIAIHPEEAVARMYFRGVIDGFYRPVDGAVTANPRRMPWIYGLEDGSALKLEKIGIDDIPTVRNQLKLSPQGRPGIKSRIMNRRPKR